MVIHAKKLIVGARYRLQGRVYRVILVNSCRARLELCGGEKVAREFDAVVNGASSTVAFATWEGPRHLDVSPYSLIERVEE